MKSTILNELKHIIEQNGDSNVTQKTVNRLLIAAMAEMIDSNKQLEDLLKSLAERIEMNRQQAIEARRVSYTELSEELCNDFDDRLKPVKDDIGKLEVSVKEIKVELEGQLTKLSKNWFVRAGVFAQEHPKMFFLLVVGFVLLVNVWFVKDFRVVLLDALGLPIDLVSPPAP